MATKRTASRDFDKQGGIRLRLAPASYDAHTRLFRAEKSLRPLLITVANARERARLWKAIEGTIAEGAWRNERTASRDAVAATAADAL